MISNQVTLHSFDKNRWVIQTNGRHLLIDNSSYELFLILKSCNDYIEAHLKFMDRFHNQIVFDQFITIVEETFGGYEILENDTLPQKPSMKGRYLKLKIQLINAKYAYLLTTPFQWLYQRLVFWSIFLITLFVVIYTYIVTDKQDILVNINYPLIIILTYATMIIHELGHIGACAKCKIKHGGIGFGFYFIFPVMYADISNIWQATKHERTIANFAGMFNEILYSFLLTILFLITKNASFIVAAWWITIVTFFELNPFVRFDGYWILSDITNTPNLLPRANKQLQKIFSIDALKVLMTQPLRWFSQFDKSSIGLSIYGVLNFIVFIGLFAYSTIVYHQSIIDFPFIIYELILKIFNGKFQITDINGSVIFPMIFYSLLLQFLILKFKTNINMLPLREKVGIN